jgi:hypothetical protein
MEIYEGFARNIDSKQGFDRWNGFDQLYVGANIEKQKKAQKKFQFFLFLVGARSVMMILEINNNCNVSPWKALSFETLFD